MLPALPMVRRVVRTRLKANETMLETLDWRNLAAILDALPVEARERILAAPLDAWTARDTFASEEPDHWSKWRNPTKYDLVGWALGPWVWSDTVNAGQGGLVPTNPAVLPWAASIRRESGNPFVALVRAHGLKATVAAVRAYLLAE